MAKMININTSMEVNISEEILLHKLTATLHVTKN